MNSLIKTSSSHLRIADILSVEEEEEPEEEEEGYIELSLMDACREPRGVDSCTGGLFSRLFSRLRRRKLKAISAQDDRRVEDVEPNTRCSTNVLNEGGDSLSTAGTQSDQSGVGCGRESETSFNIGVGCCLLYLIAASKNELDKMMKLNTQMEILLHDAKDKLAKPLESNDVFAAYSTTDVHEEGMESNYHDSSLSNNPGECLQGMDRIEAELEAELELLQLHLDKEKLLQHQEKVRIEVTVKDTASSTRSRSLSSGEVIDVVIDPQEERNEESFGVSPYELESRLHELLEARQQEQIKELEAALEWSRHKLHEKEIEVSWWKDTARLISQHVPGPSRLISDPD